MPIKNNKELEIDIVEELYVNENEILIDGFVYVKNGLRSNLVFEIENLDSYDLKGYFYDQEKKQNIEDSNKEIKNDLKNKTSEIKHIEINYKNNDEDIKKNKNEDLMKNKEKCEMVKNDSDDLIDESRLNYSCEEQKIYKFIAKDNLFLTYQRKNINLIDLVYDKNKIIIKVKQKLDFIKMKYFLSDNVYDVEINCKDGIFEYKNFVLNWEMKNVDLGEYVINFKKYEINSENEFYVQDCECINIEYECRDFVETGIKILSISGCKDYLLKRTFKVIKYEKRICK
ncbi:hypothetical protein GVAV_000461 [Gurleya vavrai]